MQLRIVILLAIFFYSCNHIQPKVTIATSKDLLIQDTSFDANQFLPFSEYDTDYPIYYIGPKLDTVKIGRRYGLGRTMWKNSFNFLATRRYTEQNLNIYVDTSIKTNAPAEYMNKEGELIQDSTINYHSFLFTIRNISDTAVYVGRTFSVFFIHREAKNKSGEWIKIDRKLSEIGLCLTFEPTVFLKPGQIVVSKVRRCSGSFATEFRLVFGHDDNVVYSNIFKDSIDERVFEKNR
jgi:hypothetical protein